MKFVILMCGCLLTSSVLASAFYDPMRPPAYALEKFRLEKIKNRPTNKSAVAKPKKKQGWVLNSILYSSQRQHAIINNKLVKKGDTISGAKLIRVEPQSVRLISRGKIIDLNLKSRYKSIRKSVGKKKS